MTIKRDFDEPDECYLYLVAKVVEADQTTYYLRSSFSHGGSSHPAVPVVWQPGEELPGMIEVLDSQDEDSFARIGHGTTEFESIFELTIKWLHVDHHHLDQCLELVHQGS